jgi:Trk K+ transport system NAD-binding subunit/Kef-type K+ transport system membrane component KefB
LEYKILITYLVGFLIVAIAAERISKAFQKVNFPIITGLIITGILGGSSFLNFITIREVGQLNFLNQIALAIIAFSAGSELYIDDLRSRIKSIKWMTIGQLLVTFTITATVVFFISNHIPFMTGMTGKHKIAIAILFATIFVARSPSSAIAIISEMRANGPFTKTVLGVTVFIDVLVIILFAVTFAIAKAFINNEVIDIFFFLILLFELIISFVLGYLVGKLLQIPFNFDINHKLKIAYIVLLGFGVYLFTDFVQHHTMQYFNHEIVLEPLLISIIASFILTNYSKHRIEFAEIIEEISPTIYIVFFTLVGASLSVQTLMSVFGIAVAFFFLRVISMYFGGILGVKLGKDDKKFTHVSWMPYVPQAGVALGLATIIAHEFPDWGAQFETIVIAMIVINQLVGPPLFKWSLNFVKESHIRAKLDLEQSSRDAVIFGVESQSLALATQLEKHNWKTRIVCMDDFDTNDAKNHEIISLHSNEPTYEDLKSLSLEKVEAVVLMLNDKKNLQIANIIYENCGTKEIIVRLNNRDYFEQFHELGALIIEPTTAMVGLLDHFVRSPNAASLLLGMDEDQDTMDVEIKNEDIHGLRIRELRLPTDIIILSIKRKGQLLMTHGYTRLRIGDIITLVGKNESLENIKFKFDS